MGVKEDNAIVEKSKQFAVRMVRLNQYLVKEKKEYVLSKQAVRSGTSIGANVHEAQRAQSRKDFLAKMSIASKEASETEYWLELLHETGYIDQTAFQSISADCTEIIKMLVSIVKATGKDN